MPSTSSGDPPGNVAERELWELAERYLAAACSPPTAATYRRHLRGFLAAVSGEITPDALIAYRARLVRDGRGPATHQQALAAVRGFLAWAGDLAQALGKPSPFPVEAVKRLLAAPRGQVRRPYQILTEREAAALLARTPAGRDRALVAVLLGAGLRVAELVGLDVADVRRQGEVFALWVRRGKGGTSRSVPVRDDVAAHVAAYLAQSGRTWASPGPLFVALPRRGGRCSVSGRLTPRAIEYRLQVLVAAAELPPGKTISPHSLRHTYAVRYLLATGNLKGLQMLLGHASIETTERYVRHLEVEALRDGLPELPRPEAPSVTR